MRTLTPKETQQAIRYAAIALQGESDDSFINFMVNEHQATVPEANTFFDKHAEEIYDMESQLTSWWKEGKPPRVGRALSQTPGAVRSRTYRRNIRAVGDAYREHMRKQDSERLTAQEIEAAGPEPWK